MTDGTALAGRVALVTGGSGGIGRALVRALAAEGAAVAVGYGASREPAEALAAEIADAGGRAVSLGADLADPDAPAQLAGVAEQALGPVDILVANHGIAARRTWEDVTLADWDAHVDVNLRAPFLLAQRVLPGMVERGFGRILFVSSIAALTGGIVGPQYAASKAGLHGLTHFLAARVAADGVTVNAIAPALIEHTGMLPGDPAELAARVPVGRLGQPEEVAALALAMLANGYLTSQVVSLDGGIYPR
jgi:3-oxoacyl-[acyl-carrier protein] reductase